MEKSLIMYQEDNELDYEPDDVDNIDITHKIDSTFQPNLVPLQTVLFNGDSSSRSANLSSKLNTNMQDLKQSKSYNDSEARLNNELPRKELYILLDNDLPEQPNHLLSIKSKRNFIFLDSSDSDEENTLVPSVSPEMSPNSDHAEGISQIIFRRKTESESFNMSSNISQSFSSAESNDQSEVDFSKPVTVSTAAPLSAKKSKKNAFNFTIQVRGNQRIVAKSQPWTIRAQDLLNEIVLLYSTDKLFYWEDETYSDCSSYSKTLTTNTSASKSQKTLSGFKIPLIRRRGKPITSSASVSNLVENNSTPVNNHNDNNSDTISLLANTFIEEDEILSKSALLSKTVLNGTSPETTKMTRIMEWVENNGNTIPEVFQDLCLNFFLNGSCNKMAFCEKYHNLENSRLTFHSLDSISDADLHEAYEFVKSEPLFFVQIYKKFALAFAARDKKDELFNLIRLIFEDPTCRIDKLEGLSAILDYLSQTSLSSFEESVSAVFHKLSAQNCPNLGESLLELIITKDDMIKYWPLLRMIITKGGKIPQKFYAPFLRGFMKAPVNLEICRETYQHILKYQCMDLKEVPENVRNAFFRVSSSKDHGNSKIERKLITVHNTQKISNVSSITLASNNFPPGNTKLSNFHSRKENDDEVILPLMLLPINKEDFAPNLVINRLGFESNNKNNGLQLNNNNLPTRNKYHGNERNFKRTYNDSSHSGSEHSFHNMPSTSTHSNSYNGSIKEMEKNAASSDDPLFKRTKLNSPLPLLDTSKCAIKNLNINSINNISIRPLERPIFGKLTFDPNYVMNVSLHNLYVHKCGTDRVEKNDAQLLKTYIKTYNGKKFFALMLKYSDPDTIVSFISAVLRYLDGLKELMVVAYKALLFYIEVEHKSHFYENITTRVILEVITMNFLFSLQKYLLFEDARDILLKFPNWDSLITSKVLSVSNAEDAISIPGRYMFISKLLLNCDPNLSYELLVCSNFHFLDEIFKWPYYPNNPKAEIHRADLDTRNNLIFLYMERKDINNNNRLELLKLAVGVKPGGIWALDARSLVHSVFCDLIKMNVVEQLKDVYKNINWFFDYMESYVFRGMVIRLCNNLNQTDLFKLFEMGHKKKVYQKIVSEFSLVYEITITTEMFPVEIELLILYFFYKLTEIKQLPPGNGLLKFNIVPIFLDNIAIKELNLSIMNRSIPEVQQVIVNILNEKCLIKAEIESPNLVVVRKNELVKYLQG